MSQEEFRRSREDHQRFAAKKKKKGYEGGRRREKQRSRVLSEVQANFSPGLGAQVLWKIVASTIDRWAGSSDCINCANMEEKVKLLQRELDRSEAELKQAEEDLANARNARRGTFNKPGVSIERVITESNHH